MLPFVLLTRLEDCELVKEKNSNINNVEILRIVNRIDICRPETLSKTRKSSVQGKEMNKKASPNSSPRVLYTKIEKSTTPSTSKFIHEKREYPDS